MAVVDHNYCFSCIDVGCNGRVSDGGVFRNCSLYQALEYGVLPENHVLVGDNVFPLKEYLLESFRGNRLKLRQLPDLECSRKPIPYSPEKVVKIVKACCALHNHLRQSTSQNKQYEYKMDNENYDSETVNPGTWRNEPEAHGLQLLPSSLSNRLSV